MSLREKFFGKEDTNDLDESGITDQLNVADDLMGWFLRIVTGLVTGLVITVAIGKVANVNGVTAFNDILRASITVFVVGIILTLALLIFVYNLFAVVAKAIFRVDVPPIELTQLTNQLVELLYQFVIS